MAGYIGSKTSVTIVDGYNKTTADSTFVDATGDTMTGNLSFGDNKKAIFGAGSDLEIYHNAGTSFITESGSSNLKIGGENLYLQNTAHNESYLVGIANADVSLYYNGAAKLATTATGIDVTGTVVADMLHIYKSDVTAYSDTAADGQVGVGPTIYLENPANSNTTVGGQIVFGMRSTESQARIAATGGANPALTFGTNDAERMRINSSGNVGIGETAPTRRLEVNDLNHTAFTGIRVNNPNGNLGSAGIEFQVDGTYSKAAIFQKRGLPNGGGDLIFVVDSSIDAANWVEGDEKLRITTSGNVGIGTTETALFNAVGGATKLAVTGSSASTNVLGNTDASIAIINTDTTANNTSGLHFARADTDNTPNYAGASIVTQFHDTQATGQYPKASMNFLTSTAANTAPSLKMTIDSSGNVGIGTSSPANKVSLKTSAGGCWVQTEDATNTSGGNVNLFGSFGNGMAAIYTTGANPISFHTNAVERMRIDSEGRLGLGITPSATTAFTVFQNRYLSLYGFDQAQSHIVTNTYYPVDNGDYKRQATGYAQKLTMVNGNYIFNIGASGAADSVITFNPAMTIDSAGRVTTPYQPAASASYGGTNLSSSAIPLNNGPLSRGGITISGNRFTVPTLGTYVVGYHNLSAQSGTQIAVRINGAAINSGFGANTQDTSGGNGNFSVQNLVSASASDYIEFYVISGSIHGNQDYNRFYIFLLG